MPRHWAVRARLAGLVAVVVIAAVTFVGLYAGGQATRTEARASESAPGMPSLHTRDAQHAGGTGGTVRSHNSPLDSASITAERMPFKVASTRPSARGSNSGSGAGSGAHPQAPTAASRSGSQASVDDDSGGTTESAWDPASHPTEPTTGVLPRVKHKCRRIMLHQLPHGGFGSAFMRTIAGIVLARATGREFVEHHATRTPYDRDCPEGRRGLACFLLNFSNCRDVATASAGHALTLASAGAGDATVVRMPSEPVVHGLWAFDYTGYRTALDSVAADMRCADAQRACKVQVKKQRRDAGAVCQKRWACAPDVLGKPPFWGHTCVRPFSHALSHTIAWPPPTVLTVGQLTGNGCGVGVSLFARPCICVCAAAGLYPALHSCGLWPRPSGDFGPRFARP